MFFLQPAMLWGLFAVSVPIIIHLLNRRRHRTVRWAAMQFLLKATRESRGKKRLRHILILTCRALGIAALVLAASIPVASRIFGFGSGKPDLIVVVVDRSVSMEARPEGGTMSRRELALERLRDAFADLGGTRLVLIDSASGVPQEVPSPEVLPDLSSTAATDTASDLPALLATAAEFLAATPGRAEIWLASDLRTSSWSPDDSRWTSVRAALSALPQKTRVRFLAFGGESADNQTVRIISSRRSGNDLLLDLGIRRSGNALTPLNLPVTITTNGVRSTENVTIPGQELRYIKTVNLSENDGSGHGWISIPGDGNPRDNASFFAYGPALPVRTALVGDGEAADYLALAAAPDGFGGQSVERIGTTDFPSTDTGGLAAVVWSADLPTGAAAEELQRFLTDGGEVLFVAPDGNATGSFLDMAWSEVETAATDQFYILDSWERNDGLLRDGIGGTPVPAERLKAVKRRIPEGDATILACWDDTRPFLVRRVVGSGTAWFMGSRPDYTWSNLGDADVLLPSVQRVVVAGADRFDSGYLTTVGSPLSAEGDVTPERLDDHDSRSTAGPRHLAGVHRVGDRILASNRPVQEDIPDVIDRASVTPLFDGVEFSLFEDNSSSGRENVSRGIWRAFLTAMLLLLLAEAILCLPNRPVSQKAASRPPVQHAR